MIEPRLECDVGRSERRKGKDAEGEVANIFRAHGLDVARTPNSGGLHVKGDVVGVPGFHIEVKRQETLRLPLWRRQALAECGDAIPAVIYRRSHEPWQVTCWLADGLPGDGGLWTQTTLDGFLAELEDALMHAALEREAAP